MKMESWIIISFISMFLYGIWGFLPKLATNRIDPKSILVFQLIGMVFVILIILIGAKFKLTYDSSGFWIAIFIGIFGGLGNLLFFEALSKGKASLVIMITGLYPLITILLSFFILKETITIKQGLGIVFALGALILFNL